MRAQTGAYMPLSNEQRWDRYWDQTFLSPGLYFASLGAASGAQLAHDPPEWRQGIAGYGRRAASQFGIFTIQTTVHEAGAAALGYEPRYLRCDCTGGWRRAGHAAKMSLLTVNREGKMRPDLPTLAGAYGSGMLSMYWYPARYHPLSDGVRAGNMQMGFVLGIHLIQEFSPEIKRVLHVKR